VLSEKRIPTQFRGRKPRTGAISNQRRVQAESGVPAQFLRRKRALGYPISQGAICAGCKQKAAYRRNSDLRRVLPKNSILFFIVFVHNFLRCFLKKDMAFKNSVVQ
jgi:hypothetical protein